MLMLVQRRATIRSLKGWAISVLLEAGAVRECDEHGWIIDRRDPHARDRALIIATQDQAVGVCQDEAIAAMEDFLESIGDSCPECPHD